MRIVFAGTPAFALPSLEAIVASGHALVGVVTPPDRPAGRGRRATAPPIKQRALELDVPILQPDGLKKAGDVASVAELAPDWVVVVAYGGLLGRRLLALPPYGCINVHASLLPRWRGAAPIARALMAGDAVTGVSLMRVTARLDAGPVLDQRALAIANDDTAGDLHDRLAPLGGRVLAERLGDSPGTWCAVDQDDALACYAPRLEKTEGAIDWSQPAAAVARQVRALNPWPVAYTTLVGQRLRVWRARALDETDERPPGTVIAADDEGLRVATGAGVLAVTELQLAGKRRVSAGAAARGHHWVGQRLG